MGRQPGSRSVGVGGVPGQYGDTSYYFFETEDLPLFGPLRTLGVPEPLIDVVEPLFREIVELGYDRSIPPWEPTPARLIPRHDPVTAAGDLVNAVGEGIDNALALIGSPSPLRFPRRGQDNADRDADVAQVYSAPRTPLKSVIREVGDGVTQVLTAVGSQLPDPPRSPGRSRGRPAQRRSRAGGDKRPDQPDHRCGEVGHRRRAHDRALRRQ